MNTPPNDASSPDAGDHRDAEHLRPVRSSREIRLPLAVRKELLITRAALERYDCAQALFGARASVHRFGRLAAWVPAWVPGVRHSQSWLRMLGIAKNYPMLSSALSLAVPLLRKTPVMRWGWKASKLGLVAGAGYWAYQTWQKIQAESTRRPRPVTAVADNPDIPAAAAGPLHTPTEPAPTDTGFRDPLVR